jgi:hypothetical protein
MWWRQRLFCVKKEILNKIYINFRLGHEIRHNHGSDSMWDELIKGQAEKNIDIVNEFI